MTIQNVLIHQASQAFPEVRTGPRIITEYEDAVALYCRTFITSFCGEQFNVPETKDGIPFIEVPDEKYNCPCIERRKKLHFIHHGIAETDAFWQTVEGGIEEANRTCKPSFSFYSISLVNSFSQKKKQLDSENPRYVSGFMTHFDLKGFSRL